MRRRQARWQEFLGQYDFDTEYIPGEENTVADALSRLPAEDLEDTAPVVSVGSLRFSTDPVWLDTIRRGYAKDDYCARLRSSPPIGFEN